MSPPPPPATVIPTVPSQLSSTTGWWKGGEVFGYVLFFAASLAATLFEDAIPKPLQNRYVWMAVGVIGITLAVAVRSFYSQLPLTGRMIGKIRQTAILSNSDKEEIGSDLTRLDRWTRRSAIGLLILGGAVVLLLIARPVTVYIRTAVPNGVSFASIRYYQPVPEQALFRAAPFLEAVRSNLVSEVGAGERSKIVIFETKPLTHPTPAFAIVFDSEKDRFELSGYAFLLRADAQVMSYEPVAADVSTDGIVRLSLPACREGDRVFGILRLTMKPRQGDFPSDLGREIRIQVNPPPEKK